MLERLLTDLGERSLYDAVSQCSRCGYCEQACPTYVSTGKEAFSGRGRNQIVRLLLEGKFNDPQAAEEALSTCLLCGACTSVCPAHVPTADIVLEGRRKLRAGRHPWLVRLLTRLLIERPRALASLMRWAYRFKAWGLAGLVVKTRALRLLGLRGLEEAAEHIDEAPREFLFERLKEDRELDASTGAAWIYFAACGSNYLFPRVGLATVKVLKAALGRGKYLANGCCGLLSYNYGELDAARTLARANIEGLERSGCPGEAAVVGDCSSCVAFLKTYPQLFLGDADMRGRAERFSERVRDFIEAVPVEKIPALPQPQTATYHDACRARNGQGISAEPRRALERAAGKAYRELPEADACCGGAGAFAFAHPELSNELLMKKTANIASTHARVVAASSTSCLVQLARGLKKYYPECTVKHLSEILAESLDAQSGHGQTTRT